MARAGGTEIYYIMSTEFPFGMMRKFWRWMMVIVVQQSECTECHWTVHLKMNELVCVCMCVLVAQSCLTICDPMDSSPPGSSVHGILQARILEWVAISFCRGPSWPRDWTWVFCIAGRFFTVWTIEYRNKYRKCIPQNSTFFSDKTVNKLGVEGTPSI